MSNAVPAYDWRDGIAAGDILLAPNGDLRVVRRVRFNESGTLRSATFSIRRCSWTHRCVTCYVRSDLKLWRLARASGWALGTHGADAAIDHDCDFPLRELERFDCCDVKGIA
jgi:hypothetical protein